jgi:hypothetical protein
VSIPSFPLPAGASTSAAQATLEESINTRLGEVSASPAANTVLDRLKAILTELQLKSDLSETQPVSMASFPTDSRLATAVDATASGDTTIVSITNSPRLYYVSLSANGANSADVTVIVRIGASEKYKVSLKAGAIWARNIGAGRNYITGSAGDDIIVNLSAAQTVHVSVEYADI